MKMLFTVFLGFDHLQLVEVQIAPARGPRGLSYTERGFSAEDEALITRAVEARVEAIDGADALAKVSRMAKRECKNKR